eukprot:SAG11_NODE_13662_length_644_cov_2.594495_2_plen_101_part_00
MDCLGRDVRLGSNRAVLQRVPSWTVGRACWWARISWSRAAGAYPVRPPSLATRACESHRARAQLTSMVEVYKVYRLYVLRGARGTFQGIVLSELDTGLSR